MKNFRLLNIASAFSILIASQVLAQEKETYNISPELTSTILLNKNVDKIDVYKVQKMDVDVPLFEKTQVLTSYYKRQKDDVDNNRKYFDAYQQDKIKIVIEYNEKLKIVELLNQFISSRGKYEDKVNLLESAEVLVNKYDLEFYENNVGTAYDSRYLTIIPAKGKAKKKDLRWIIAYLNKNRALKEAVCGYKCLEYKQDLANLSKIDSTETHLVNQGKTIKRTFNKATPIDIMLLSGTYELISDDYQRIIAQFTNEYYTNQIVNKSSYTRKLEITKKYPLIRNIETGEEYFFERNSFLVEYEVFTNTANLPKVLASKGYVAYEKNDKQYIDTSVGPIELTYVLSKYLDDNPNFIASIESTNKKLLNYQQQAITLGKKLEPYSSLYSIQYSMMATSKINEWRNLTKRAITLLKNIVKTQETYGTYQYLPSYNTKTFLDELSTARYVLSL
jgi:hypothetical protein